jgi:DNA/RNA-binding domain of Phe-tRNA-synthetase-like protein
MESIDFVEIAEFSATVRPGLGWISAEVGSRPATTTLTAALAAAREAARTREPTEIPAIAATRNAYRALGKDPARYRPSAEALLRRLRKGEPLPELDPRVDLGTLVSLETGFSIGVYDRETLRPPIVARPGRVGESYLGIGGIAFNLEGLPLLADREGPFGSPTRDSARTAVRPETRAILFVLYGFAPHPVDAASLEHARKRLEDLLGARILAAKLAR